MTESAAALVALLEDATHRFGPEARAVKWRAVSALAGRPLRSPRLLLRLHEALCFLRAYPDDAELLAAVDGSLAGFAGRVAALRRPALDETGVAGTAVYCPLSLPVARWLAARFPGAVELDREDADGEDALAAVLPAVVDPLAEEALVEAGVGYRAWLAAAKRRDARSDLAWLLDGLARRARSRPEGLALYDHVQPRLRWALGDGPASRTLARVAGRPVFFHRGPLRPRGRGLGRRLPGPPVAVRAASRGEGEVLLDAARAAVTVRYREVHAFNFGDPAAVVVGAAGRGVEIAWFGVRPEHRLPLRAHYGYLLLKNGVPVGYGDASLLFEWCEIAFNVFETFRRGESGYAFARLLGFVSQWLGVRGFHLSPYQLGRGNDEALASGAFWFYAKLGFRSSRPDLARLAGAERRRLARDPAYRSPRETLARLAEGGLFVAVGGSAEPAVRAFRVRRLGLRAAAQAASPADLARRLGAGSWRSWPRLERLAFARLAPFLALVPDLERWPARERRALVAIARAKGGPTEAGYLRRLQGHRRLRASLLRLGGPEP